MTKGTNKSIFKFKVTDKKSKKTRYFFTGDEIVENLGFPRGSIYYSLRYKGGLIGDYQFERIYIPKKLLHTNGCF